MTMLQTPNQLTVTPAIGRTLRFIVIRLKRMINGIVAALITNAARRMEQDALRRLSDRELKDIGL